MLHVALPQILHQEPAAVGGPRGEQQMHVVGHEAIGMHCTAEPWGQVLKRREIERVVLIPLFSLMGVPTVIP